ncbi:MAG: hypothetical protein ABIJ61_08610, partial [bacterium]
MKKIKSGFILPSAALTVPRSRIENYASSPIDKQPQAGDLVYGRIAQLVQHMALENKQGRIHAMNEGTRAIFVLGNRYAPDYYEGFVPDELPKQLDLLARSGIIGVAKYRSTTVKDPTQVKVLGFVLGSDGKVINTRDFNKIIPKTT